MRFRRNLRFRVALGFALLGMGVCLGMTLGLDYATDQLEQRLLEETMSTELLDSAAHFELDPDQPLPVTPTIRRYVLTGSTRTRCPPGCAT